MAKITTYPENTK